jgi:dTDP-4-amino-4,6-dideoxygalactose transaminase
LPLLKQYSKNRNAAAAFYDQELGEVPQIQIPEEFSNSTHVFHQYTIKVLDGQRTALKDFLYKKGIPTMIY